MRGLSFTSGGTIYRQVTKKTAKKLYLQGFPVVLCPCNLRPFTPWHCEHTIKKADRAQFVADEIGAANDFDNVVNSFEYYNCQYNETGKYTAFYIGDVSGVYFVFADGSSSFTTFGDMKTVQRAIKKYSKHYSIKDFTVSGAGIVTAVLEKIKA
jgi:hypothetical protein